MIVSNVTLRVAKLFDKQVIRQTSYSTNKLFDKQVIRQTSYSTIFEKDLFVEYLRDSESHVTYNRVFKK